jgi:pimeloyl-ACP methyl ester carboxylesterase
MADRIVTGDGIGLRWKDESEGPAIVLVHGVGANLESWDGVTRQLRNRYRVIRYDLRGHGASDRIQTCSIEAFTDDVLCVAERAGLAQFHLVGFSLGGLIAQHFAIHHQDRLNSLALLSTVANRTEQERARILARADVIREQGIKAIANDASDRWFTPAFKEKNPEKVAARLVELAANDAKSYEAAYRVFGTADKNLEFRRIDVPTLVATGEEDPNSNVRMAHELHLGIAGSRLKILPKLKHSILVEAPDLVAEILIDHISTVDEAIRSAEDRTRSKTN